MKKLILAICLLTVMLAAHAQSSFERPKPIVDERTELLGIVFRLAEAHEYVNNHIKIYTDEVDTYFAPFKEHELIKWIPELRKQYGISYDAVASFAIHIKIKNNKITFIEGTADLEKRWTDETAKEFLKKLNDFYKKSKFNEFYTKHKPLYSIAEERFVKVLDEVNFDWFEKYYGEKPEGKFNLVISFTNGGGNYGARVNYKNGKQEMYAIMGSWATDSVGHPTYSPQGVLSTVIHEYNHSFCNPLIDEYYAQMSGNAEEFFKEYEDILRRQAYGTAKTMMYEMLVRASVIQYYKDAKASQKSINSQIGGEQQRGFIFIDTLCQTLDTYEQQRNKYLTLRSFMPEVVKLVNGLTVEREKTTFEQKAVKITSTSIADNATDVKPGIHPLTVTFDKPMLIGNNGTTYGKRGKDYFPKFAGEKAKWNNETKKEWTVYLDLEPDKEYSISFPAMFFMGENGEPVFETYYLDFKTAKE